MLTNESPKPRSHRDADELKLNKRDNSVHGGAPADVGDVLFAPAGPTPELAPHPNNDDIGDLCSAEPLLEIDPDDIPIPMDIWGQPVALEQHPQRPRDRGIRVPCWQPDHPGCRRFRNVYLDVETLGVKTAQHYLLCWLFRGAEMTATQHADYHPTVGEVVIFVGEYIPPEEH
jgi:hypothetical protein